MDPKNVTWKREWRGTIQGKEDDPDSSYELVITEPDNQFGKFFWRASDYMAWHDRESHGDGFTETLEEAQEAAKQWFFVDRFNRPNTNLAPIIF